MREGRTRETVDHGRAAEAAPTPGKRTCTDKRAGAPRAPGRVQPAIGPVQRAMASAITAVAQDLRTPAEVAPGEVASEGLAGAHARLPHLDVIQRAFGRHDIGGVRIANDGAARRASDALGARAYVVGDRVALPHGADLFTEAHEAAHVVQQRAGRVATDGQPGDAHERQADAVAEKVVRGESAEALLDELAPGSATNGRVALQRLEINKQKAAAEWQYQPGDPKLDALYAQLLSALDAYHRHDVPVSPDELGGELDPGAASRPSLSAAQLEPLFDVLRLASEFHQALPRQSVHVRTSVRVQQLINDCRGELNISLRTHWNTNAARRVAKHDDRLRRVVEHQRLVGFNGRRLESHGIQGPAIVQNCIARGDMYHVRPALALFPSLKVIIYGIKEPEPQAVDTKPLNDAELAKTVERAALWEQACTMASYYGVRDRVFYTFEPSCKELASTESAYALHRRDVVDWSGLFIDVGGCTTLIALEMRQAREQGWYASRRQDLANSVAPLPPGGNDRRRAIIRHLVQTLRFEKGKPYVLVNFRGSGHKHVEKQLANAHGKEQRDGIVGSYDPTKNQATGNHPELDTGIVGFEQLFRLVELRGFIPVAMGDPAVTEARVPKPHLINYFKCDAAKGGRAAEAYFLRVLHEEFDVRQLAMRSGVTDLGAFVGIPTISIDIDNFNRASTPLLFPRAGYLLGGNETAHTWARGNKLEAGLGRDYGRVFISHDRNLKAFDAEGHWCGEFHRDDLARIDHAIAFYFGRVKRRGGETILQAPDPSWGMRHYTHPFHEQQMKETLAATTGEGDVATIARRQLHFTLRGRFDGGLNPEAVLQHVALLLAAMPPRVAEARQCIDRQLELMTSLLANEAVQRRARRQEQLFRFLGQVLSVVAPDQDLVTHYTAMRAPLRDNKERFARAARFVEALLKIHRVLADRLEYSGRRRVLPYRTALAGIATGALRAELEAVRALVLDEDVPEFSSRVTDLVETATELRTDIKTLCAGAEAALAAHRAPIQGALEVLADRIDRDNGLTGKGGGALAYDVRPFQEAVAALQRLPDPQGADAVPPRT